MASVTAPLVISGSRKSDGTANASGTVYAYIPGTTTPVNLYADADATVVVTQPIVLDEGGRIPRTDYPDGIWVTQPVRLLIQGSDTAVVSDTTYTPATAGNTAVVNDGFTGTVMDQVLDAAHDSFGGQDFTYKESNGATERTVKEKFSEIWISVKDFGATGVATQVATTYIQAAMNRVKTLGGGVVYFPPGTYLVDQELSLTSAVGVTLLGVRGATFIVSNHATDNVFTFATASTQCGIDGLIISHSATSTGTAISMSAASQFTVAFTVVTTGDFNYGISLSGASDITVDNSNIAGDARGMLINTTGTNFQNMIRNTIITGNSTAALELNGSGGDLIVLGGKLTGTVGILFNASYTGGFVKVFGCRNTATLAYDMTGLSKIPLFQRWGDGVDGYTVNVTTGATVTPDLSKGPHIRIVGTTTGSAYIVAAPTPPPQTTVQGPQRDYYIRISFANAAGGAITGWTMNAAYHLSAGPSTTDTQITSYILLWDPDAGVWREYSRAVTT